MNIRGFTAIAVFALTASSATLAGNPKGPADHPLFSRYPGSDVLFNESRAYDEFNLITAAVPGEGGPKKYPEAFRHLEGKVTRIVYRAPPEHSTLEVLHNYEEALQGAGFESLFKCTNQECGDGIDQTAPLPPAVMLMAYNKGDQRFLAAHRSRDGTDVHVGLYVVRASSIGGDNHDRILYELDVVESGEMKTGLVHVNAAAMAKGLDAEGHIALYDVYFNTDKADLKPESDMALVEIAKLLSGDAKLKVLIVGHTDNVGELAYNQSLSERRARAVVDALVKKHAIAPARLTAVGVGMAAPLASNDGEAGRARNRRVELVKR